MLYQKTHWQTNRFYISPVANLLCSCSSDAFYTCLSLVTRFPPAEILDTKFKLPEAFRIVPWWSTQAWTSTTLFGQGYCPVFSMNSGWQHQEISRHDLSHNGKYATLNSKLMLCNSLTPHSWIVNLHQTKKFFWFIQNQAGKKSAPSPQPDNN